MWYTTHLYEVLLQVQPLRAGVEDPLEPEVGGRVGDDVAGDADLLPLGHAVHLHLVRLAERLVWKKRRKTCLRVTVIRVATCVCNLC